MPTRASSADINSYLDAYAVLGVEHSANPAEIGRAYKVAARTHHPDRYPAGSDEQRNATERMRQINAAYQLVRDAPLRFHRVSTRSRPDEAWTDTELDAAIRRAKNERTLANVLSGFAAALFLFLPWFLYGVVSGAGSPSTPFIFAVALVYLGIAVLAATGGVSPRVWDVLHLFRFLTRF